MLYRYYSRTGQASKSLGISKVKLFHLKDYFNLDIKRDDNNYHVFTRPQMEQLAWIIKALDLYDKETVLRIYKSKYL